MKKASKQPTLQLEAAINTLVRNFKFRNPHCFDKPKFQRPKFLNYHMFLLLKHFIQINITADAGHN